ncbi:MAG: hypothetical protein DVB23_000685 [Verrucomicrobia bacterium]|jgi:hypothetical protein|nr:MAG: hypothetical protein DVB23_000685 [Verrucomicrobiota bacterium]
MATEGIVTGSKQKRHTRFVDMWIAAGLNPTNIEILTKLKSAEDRQFSQNMAVTGKGFDEDRQEHKREESHLFGIRTDVWRPSKEVRERTLAALEKRQAKERRAASKSKESARDASEGELDQMVIESDTSPVTADDIDKSRLVIKMFRNTSSRIRWQGTIEELSVREIQNSLGSRRALASFAVILAEYEHLIVIQQNRRLFRIPPSFSFSYYQAKTDRMWYIDLDCHWVSIGIDYTILAQGRKIGSIDGKLLALGADSRIHVQEPCLAEDEQFMDLLSLFAATVGFHKQIRSHIRRRVSNVKRGRSVHFVEDEEMWLLKNPRRIAR